MTAGFNFNNYAAGFCSATPALRGNEVSMDTIDLGNSESLVPMMNFMSGCTRKLMQRRI